MNDEGQTSNSNRLNRVRPLQLVIPTSAPVDQEVAPMDLPADVISHASMEEVQNQPDIPDPEPQSWSIQVLDDQIEALSSIEKENIKLVLLVRYLVIIQPILAIVCAALVTIVIYIKKSASIIPYISIIVPGCLLIFSMAEVILVSRITMVDMGKAITYNIINKLLYAGELIIMGFSLENDTCKAVALALLLLHLGFFLWANWYKRRNEILQFLMSVVNPVIMATLFLVQLRYSGYLVIHASICTIPALIFCVGYLGFCLYYSLLICKEVCCSMSNDELENEQDMAQVAGFASVLGIVTLINVSYIGGLLGGGFLLEKILASTDKEKALNEAFSLFLGLALASLFILLLLYWRFSALTVYFKLRFMSTIRVVKGEPVTPGRKKMKSRFLLKMSSSYFNNDDREVKKQLQMRNRINKFKKDITKMAEIPDSPSRVKRYCKNIVTNKDSNLYFKRMDSMHDIGSPDKKSELGEGERSPTLKNVPYRSEIQRMNSISKQPSSALRKRTQRLSLISPSTTRKSSAVELSTPKLFKMHKKAFQRSVAKQIEGGKDKSKAEADVCMVCHEHPADTIVDPCMHGGCCHLCAVATFSKGNKKCMLCRQKIERIYKAEVQDHNIVKIIEDITPENINVTEQEEGEESVENE